MSFGMKGKERILMLYFAYGSNMSEKRLEERVSGHYVILGKALLRGHRLVFNKESMKNPSVGFANVIEDPQVAVEGVLYEVEEGEMQELDRREGVPSHYRRVFVEVETDEGAKKVTTYIACPEKVKEGLLPTREYLEHLLKGRKYLTDEYFKKLKHQTTID